jgi:rod shape-determining protein MreB and related proteins
VATEVAIDVGTAWTRLATREAGLVLEERTQVAVDTGSGQVVAIGEAARASVVGSQRHVVVFRPLEKGATVDFDVAARLLRAMFTRAGFGRFTRLKAVMSVPVLATSIERRALRQAALQAGAVDVTLIEAPIAAAVGLGMPVQNPVASAVVTLGAGASEVALISLGGIVTQRSLHIGGNDLDRAIAADVRSTTRAVIAPLVAASLKESLGSALDSSAGESQLVPARTVRDGLAVNAEVPAELVNRSIKDALAAIVRMVQECLRDAPPDLAQDVITQGLTMAGGASQLRDLGALLSRETGVTVHDVTDPQRVIVRGLVSFLGQDAATRRLLSKIDV